MWRSIFAVLLLPSLTAAQNQPAPLAPPDRSYPTSRAANLDPGPKDPEPKDPGPKYKSFTFYDSIRRGREEEIVVSVSAPGLVTTSKSPVQGIVPLSLELDPVDGLSVSGLRYPKTTPRRVKFQSEPVPVVSGPDIRFKIKADRNAVMGTHVLTGKITFQAIPYDGSAPGPVQQVEVQIPISVVEHDAKVQKQPWPIAHVPVALIILIIVLLPVEIPLGLLLMAGCVVSPRSCPD
jgi:hypothetical protein